jgi:hypothetical protein
VFLDIQVGHSTVKTEVTELGPYLALPNVHLGIDPEFSLKTERYWVLKLVLSPLTTSMMLLIFWLILLKKQATPKVLVIHRFTQGMLTNYKKIKKSSRSANSD